MQRLSQQLPAFYFLFRLVKFLPQCPLLRRRLFFRIVYHVCMSSQAQSYNNRFTETQNVTDEMSGSEEAR